MKSSKKMSVYALVVIALVMQQSVFALPNAQSLFSDASTTAKSFFAGVWGLKDVISTKVTAVGDALGNAFLRGEEYVSKKINDNIDVAAHNIGSYLVRMPKVAIPNMPQLPSLQNIQKIVSNKLPNYNMPKIAVPNVETIQTAFNQYAPQMSIPKLSIPTMPTVEQVKKVITENLPKLSLSQAMPTVSIPTLESIKKAVAENYTKLTKENAAQGAAALALAYAAYSLHKSPESKVAQYVTVGIVAAYGVYLGKLAYNKYNEHQGVASQKQTEPQNNSSKPNGWNFFFKRKEVDVTQQLREESSQITLLQDKQENKDARARRDKQIDEETKEREQKKRLTLALLEKEKKKQQEAQEKADNSKNQEVDENEPGIAQLFAAAEKEFEDKELNNDITHFAENPTVEKLEVIAQKLNDTSLNDTLQEIHKIKKSSHGNYVDPNHTLFGSAQERIRQLQNQKTNKSALLSDQA